MRQIEFRAWDKKAKVMIYPVVVYETQDHVGFSEETFRRCYDQNEWYEHLEVGDDWYYLFDDKVMQYTGLQDANGHEIFEGDVIRESHHAGNSEFDVANCIVSFKDGSFVYDFKALNYGRLGTYGTKDRKTNEYRKHLVIGNIYQNKELLNEVKKWKHQN